MLYILREWRYACSLSGTTSVKATLSEVAEDQARERNREQRTATKKAVASPSTTSTSTLAPRNRQQTL
jgi:hypothetical protein